MPQKLKTKLSSLDVFPPKLKRGRPRKTVAPDALTPFGKQEMATVEESKCLGKKSEPVVAKPNSRRMNPTTSDRSYSADEVEFMNALAEFKRASGRTFPTCSEILGVLRRLGYEKLT